jgi:type IV pilus biogenesis protein CpaD/CtpE
MKKLVVVAALLLAGCTSNPADMLGTAYITADTLVVTAHQLCRNEEPGGPCAPDAVLTTAQKDKIRDRMQEVASLLTEARSLLAIGQEAAAMDSLTRARFLLRLVENILLEAEYR